MNFPWYKICGPDDYSLEQGDFVKGCPIIIPADDIDEDDELEIEIEKIDSIILSQSCDLENGNISLVLVCPYYTLKYWLYALPKDRHTTKKARIKTIRDLQNGSLPGYHLLNKDEKVDFADYQVVDFKNVYGINFNLLVKIVAQKQKRVRLLSPYKEHLSQAFARYFMRVGLPNDIVVEGY